VLFKVFDVAVTWPLLISIASAVVALLSAAYTRRQARTAERARASEFDPQFRVRRVRYTAFGPWDEETREYGPTEPGPTVARLEQVGNATARQLRLLLHDEWSMPQDASPGWSSEIGRDDDIPRVVRVRWRSETGNVENRRVRVPPSDEVEVLAPSYVTASSAERMKELVGSAQPAAAQWEIRHVSENRYEARNQTGGAFEARVVTQDPDEEGSIRSDARLVDEGEALGFTWTTEGQRSDALPAMIIWNTVDGIEREPFRFTLRARA
jgi:hypothetical protein